MTRPMPALAVIDVQVDFCPGGALAVPNGHQVVPPLNRMMEYFFQHRLPIYASRDWHPPDTEHFKEYGGPWPIHGVADTPGAEFHPDLILPKGVFIINKGTDRRKHGYSAFEGLISLSGESLKESLRRHGVTDLFIGGLATGHCVKATTLDAIKLAKDPNHPLEIVYLLTDACKAINPNDEKDALREMHDAGVIFMNTKAVLRLEFIHD